MQGFREPLVESGSAHAPPVRRATRCPGHGAIAIVLAAWIAAVSFSQVAEAKEARARTEPERGGIQHVASSAFDAAVLRPLGLVAVVVGAGLFVPAAVLTAPGGLDPLEEALEIFVLVPGKYVFTRPLGDF